MTTPIDLPEPPVAEPDVKPPLADQLAQLLNRYCAENKSNTPDFILADYMLAALAAFEAATKARDQWYSTPGTEILRGAKS